MTRTAQQLEEIAVSDLLAHKRTVRRIRHWQRHIWRASHPEDFGQTTDI